eukprot:sb/3473899/
MNVVEVVVRSAVSKRPTAPLAKHFVGTKLPNSYQFSCHDNRVIDVEMGDKNQPAKPGPTPATTTRDGKLKSEFMKKDDKRYFLDLKENSRGRFLRVSQVVRYTRQHVAFPAILLVELRNTINEDLSQVFHFQLLNVNCLQVNLFL